MAPHWKLTVEGFGKIEQAEVDVRPLTLFVGPNNSGKSYLASLIWGIVAMQAAPEPPEGPVRDAVDEWLRIRLGRDASIERTQIEPEQQALFNSLFESSIKKHSNALVQKILNSDSTSLRDISFQNVSESQSVFVDVGLSGDNYQVAASVPDYTSSWGFRRSDLTDKKMIPILRELLVRASVFERMFSNSRRQGDAFETRDPIYLPASRTGFMQLYKAAARRSLQSAFRFGGDTDDWLDITMPSFHFIDMIAFGLKLRQQPGRFAEEAELLESSLAGRVELLSLKGAVNEYQYHPVGTTMPLPLKLSSTLVTELVPVISVLRYASSAPLLVYEEPEAHLHPELQRLVAQVLVRLVRKGLIVVITTHSADFCQQINNFMKLGALSPDKRAEAQKKFGYESQDYLDLDDVSGYEFKLDETGQHTSVVEMKKHSAGLVMPTFNQSLASLTDQVFALQDLLAEQEDAT